MQSRCATEKAPIPRLRCGEVRGVVEHSLSDLFGFELVARRLAPVVPALGDLMKHEAGVAIRGGGQHRGRQQQLVAVKVTIGNGDERRVLATVMPSQHPLGESRAEIEDALDVLQRGSLGRARGQILVFVFKSLLIIVDHAVEKAGRRELLVVAHHHNLAAPRDRAQGVLGPYLAGFVDHQQIELDPAGRQVLGDRERAHQEHRLEPLDGFARLFHELADRFEIPRLADLVIDDAHGAGRARRLLVQMRPRDLIGRQGDAVDVRGAEPSDEGVQLIAGDPLDLGITVTRLGPFGFVRSEQQDILDLIRRNPGLERLIGQHVAADLAQPLESLPDRRPLDDIGEPIAATTRQILQVVDRHAVLVSAIEGRGEVQVHGVGHGAQRRARVCQRLPQRAG